MIESAELISLIVYLVVVVIGLITPFLFKSIYESLENKPNEKEWFYACIILWPVVICFCILGAIMFGCCWLFEYLLKKRWQNE